MKLFSRILISLTLACTAACSGGGTTDSVTTDDQATGSTQTNNTSPAQSGPVLNKVEQAGDVAYKIYLQPEANGSNRKGIILFGAGNNGSDPSTGSLNDGLLDLTAMELANRGYVAAIVAYRDQPALVKNDNGVSWNANSQMLATDMSNVADAIIATHGPGLSRDRVITAGKSYTSYSILTNLALDQTPLADTKGFLAACGATASGADIKIPVYTLNCDQPSGKHETGKFGNDLYQDLNDSLKGDSGFFADACDAHCGSDDNIWSSKMVERTQLWLP